MKSSIIYSDKIGDYPVLMRHSSTVVLFTSLKVGTVVVSNNKNEIGEYREDWIMDCFEKFNDKVVLEN